MCNGASINMPYQIKKSMRQRLSKLNSKNRYFASEIQEENSSLWILTRFQTLCHMCHYSLYPFSNLLENTNQENPHIW